MRTSYSAIETYLQCPQKYKFQEIDKIRAPKSKEALFGTLIHGTLKFMFERNPLFPTLDEVVDHFRAHWPSREKFELEVKNDPMKRAWTGEEEKIYFEEGVRMLKRFYEKNAPWNYVIVDLESRFELPIEDEKTGATHVLAGIIDRIDRISDGSYEIIDYKTSKKMPSQENVDKNLQMSLYSLGLQKRWPHVTSEDIALSLYFVKHGEKLSTRRTPDTLEKTRSQIIETIRSIQERTLEKKEFEPMPSVLCNWCEYRPLCPAWKHLYRKSQNTSGVSPDEIGQKVDRYLEIKKLQKEHKNQLVELEAHIKEFMEKEALTRVFGGEGHISKKTIQRFSYDFEKVRALLSPLGKWEEVIKADEAKLKRLLKTLPEDVRLSLEEARILAKEYSVLSHSAKKTNEMSAEGV
ncbi:MAG: PD-(D/E)XK nuclease family protein [Candidatus Colwellbacteria bacterium]|nr:PD-(D/E)XK nuclease family protein [Candidatus Colwellbacteria bacterium]